MTGRDNDRNFQSLKQTYIKCSIVLYVGAGSSRGDDGCEYGIPGWWGLLEQILRRGAEHITEKDCADLKKKKDPWDAADFVLSKMPGGEKQRKDGFQCALWEVIRDERNYSKSKKYKLINPRLLNQNATLNAIVAFCGGISAWVENKDEQPRELYFTYRPNQRVRALLTTNYDPFLEAAASLKYRKSLLKPVAAYGSDAGTIDQIPVFHIHGYVPHPLQAKERTERQPYVDELVLDRSSYLAAWKSTDVFGPTMLPQIHYLRNYTTLFVGFSFSDERVNNLLKDIHIELSSHNRSHFALVSEKEFKYLGKNFYQEIGIVPIRYATPKEIPERLGELYRAGLEADQKDAGDEMYIPWVTVKQHKSSTLPPRCTATLEYWNALLCSRLCRVSVSKLIAGGE
jgi:hypothetical protein